MVDLSRREFMLAGTTSLLAMPGSVQAQLDPADTDADAIRGVADLLGPRDARPEPGDPFFEEKLAYAYRYQASDTGRRFFITENDDAWAALPVSAPQVAVGDDTELFESDEGSTVLQNTAGNPINIQLYPSGRAFMTENTVETVIDVQNEWVPIEGAWEAAHLNFLTHAAGELTYAGDVTTQTQYMVGGTYVSPSNNARYEIAMFKDETVKDRTIIDFSPPRQDEALSLPSVFGFTDTTTTGMSHSVRVRCTSGATNITVRAINFTLRG